MARRFKRHDLVDLAPAARRAMAAEVLGDRSMWPEDEVRRLVADGYGGVLVPGIVRRQDARQEGLGIGLSSPYRQDGMRLRASACVPPAAVTLVRDPYQVAALADRAARSGLRPLRVLALVRAKARDLGLACGVFGSTALELATGLPYCHEESDLDVIVRYERLDEAERFFEALSRLEEESGVRVDAELELRDGSALKLAELFGEGDSVLVKGFDDVRLISKEEAVAMGHIPLFRSKEGEASWM